MPGQPVKDHLAEDSYATLVLRLVIDRRRHLTHGEVVDVEARSSTRFQGRRGLTRALRTCLARLEQTTLVDDQDVRQ